MIIDSFSLDLQSASYPLADPIEIASVTYYTVFILATPYKNGINNKLELQ